MEKIISRANPLLVHMKKLAASGAYRREQGVYLGDSPKLLAEALKWHAPIREIAITGGTALPSQYVVLGLRDYIARRAGDAIPGMPLDDKLFAVKGAALLTIATLAGRVSVPFDVLGYQEGWQGFAAARLLVMDDGFELRLGVNPRARQVQEASMNSEGILQRIGRLIAGYTHMAIDKAENLDRPAMVEQMIREIDGAADQARTELGRATAEQHRINSRKAEIERETDGLQEKVAVALREGRDDLARAGVSRSIDLEAQTAALDSALRDVEERIADGRKAMLAVAAAREDAQARLRDLRRSESAPAGAGGSGAGGGTVSATDRAARTSAAIARLTGVAADRQGGTDPAGLDELERLHRERQIEDRLAALKKHK